MQTTTTQYVYFGTTGSHTRQPRTNPAAAFLAIPGVQNVTPLSLVEGSSFQPDLPPSSFQGSDGNTYQLAFMSVSGCIEGGSTWFPGTILPTGTVGNANINVLVVYIVLGGGPGGGGSAATIDAFDETLGTLVDDTFVNVFDPSGTLNPGETQNGNVQGFVDTTDSAEQIQALSPSLNYPSGTPTKRTFDKWGILYTNGSTVVETTDPTKLLAAQDDSPYAFAFYKSPVVLPMPYVIGGYQSPDIILIDLTTGKPVTTLDPSGSTLLQPDTSYGLQAVIHNDDPNTDAVNTEVTFWEIPGGAGASAVLLDTQTGLIIPRGGSLTVTSSVNFSSGQSLSFPAVHNCAAVSVYNAIAGSCANATTAAELLALSNITGQPSCSAWRNTDSQSVSPGLPFHFGLGLGDIFHLYGLAPVEIQVQTHHVPPEWYNEPKVKEIAGLLKTAGVRASNPLFLLPSLQSTLKSVNLGTKVDLKEGGKLQELDHKYVLNHEKGKASNFEVSGAIPKTAKPGDVFLVNVTAHYPATDHIPAKVIGFLEILLVANK